MKIIAHRGNIDGPSSLENHPDYITSALNEGFDVEVDVWAKESDLFLGHDEPHYKIDINFLHKIADRSWIHCKNLKAIEVLSNHDNLNVFWHQEDDFVLTRSNHIWTFPGKELGAKSIAVMPKDLEDASTLKLFGVCTDYPRLLRKLVQHDS
jgi:hypothetical protein